MVWKQPYTQLHTHTHKRAARTHNIYICYYICMFWSFSNKNKNKKSGNSNNSTEQAARSDNECVCERKWAAHFRLFVNAESLTQIICVLLAEVFLFYLCVFSFFQCKFFYCGQIFLFSHFQSVSVSNGYSTHFMYEYSQGTHDMGQGKIWRIIRNQSFFFLFFVILLLDNVIIARKLNENVCPQNPEHIEEKNYDYSFT